MPKKVRKAAAKLCFKIQIVVVRMVIVQFAQLITKTKIFVGRMMKLVTTVKCTMDIRMQIRDCKERAKRLFFHLK